MPDADRREAGERDVRALPKAHLHLHLEGSARPETIAELLDAAGHDPHDFRNFDGWEGFLASYVRAMACITSLDAVTRICRELIEDEAAEGVAYTEPHVAPDAYAMLLGCAPDEALAAMLAGFREGSEATGVEYGLVVAAMRDLPPDQAEMRALYAAERVDRGVVAFGLAGSEHMAGPELFARAAAVARDAGLLVVPHAGELAGPESVWGALDEMGAHRIAHGVRSVEDADLMARLAGEGIACDVCVTSNVALGVVESVDEHPLPELLEAGVPVTLGSDDQLMFGSRVADEYALARDTFSLSDETLAAIARTSIDASGAPDATKVRLRTAIDDWLVPDGS
jgi:adenosine deaminase